jgi:hypothetical protein
LSLAKFKLECEDRPEQAHSEAELQRNAGEVKAPSLAAETNFKPPAVTAIISDWAYTSFLKSGQYPG